MIFTKTYQKMLKQGSKKFIGVMKDEWSGKIMKVFVYLRAKTYSYLMDDGKENKKKKAKDTERCVIKRNLSLKIIKTV